MTSKIFKFDTVTDSELGSKVKVEQLIFKLFQFWKLFFGDYIIVIYLKNLFKNVISRYLLRYLQNYTRALSCIFVSGEKTVIFSPYFIYLITGCIVEQEIKQRITSNSSNTRRNISTIFSTYTESPTKTGRFITCTHNDTYLQHTCSRPIPLDFICSVMTCRKIK